MIYLLFVSLLNVSTRQRIELIRRALLPTLFEHPTSVYSHLGTSENSGVRY